jgi:serine/threonine protein kinase
MPAAEGLRAASTFGGPNLNDVVPWSAKCPKCTRTYAADKVPKDWICVECSTHVWQPDDEAPTCMACRRHPVGKFTRHHCRKCGNVVCDACSKFTMVIKEWGPEKRRVCNLCAVPKAEVVKEGYLCKLGAKGVFKQERLQRRYFQLKGTFLVYANAQHGAYYGCINVTRGRVMEDESQPHALVLMAPLLIRGYVLSASSDEEKQEWREAFDEVFRRERAGTLYAAGTSNNMSMVHGRTGSRSSSDAQGDRGPLGRGGTNDDGAAALDDDFASIGSGSPLLRRHPVDDSNVGALSNTHPRLRTSVGVSVTDIQLGATTTRMLMDNFEARLRERQLGLRQFELVKVIGIGSCSHVTLVRRRGTTQLLAMKTYGKAFVAAAGPSSSASPKSERDLLVSLVNDPDPALDFIARLKYAFQTRTHLFLVTEYCPGGELFFHLQLARRFSEDRARLYTAELAVALDALHRRGIIYRDLKPENVVIRADGHATLVDFALAKAVGPRTGASSKKRVDLTELHRATDFCGTPEYMAPEVVERLGHSAASDWWSLGVLLYEMAAGLPPFCAPNATELYDIVLSQPVNVPKFFSAELQALIPKLLEKEPSMRLQNVEDLFAQPFFRGLTLVRVTNQDTKPEFVPTSEAAADVRQFAPSVTEMAVPSYLDTPADEHDSLHIAKYAYPEGAAPKSAGAAAESRSDVLPNPGMISAPSDLQTPQHRPADGTPTVATLQL